MSELAQDLKQKIEHALPGSWVHIDDPDGAHLSAEVVAEQFRGLPRLGQHKLVYAALGDAFNARLHALRLTTRVPE